MSNFILKDIASGHKVRMKNWSTLFRNWLAFELKINLTFSFCLLARHSRVLNMGVHGLG